MDDSTIMAELNRLHDEEKRQNHRLDVLEETMKTIQSITLQVQRLADGMNRMCDEQQKQGERLEKLESKPAEAWNTMTRTIFTTVVSAVGGGLAVGLWQMINAGMQ